MQTVVGVFDSVDDAQHARKTLIDAGFDQSAVQVQSQSSMDESGSPSSASRSSTSTTSSTSASGESSEGFMSGIGHFFSNLFGVENDEHAGHYSEAVRRGGTVVVVTVPDESRVEPARLALANAGAVDIEKRTENWRQQGYSGFDPAAKPFNAQEIKDDVSKRQQPQTGRVQAANGTVLPVIREEIDVGKKEVDLGAVRVFSRTEMKPVQEQVQLPEQHAEIERRPIDRPATEADLKAFEDGSIEVREMAERAVVSKTARVDEEVVVGTKDTTRTETVSDQLRNTAVEVDKAKDQPDLKSQAMPDYRSHYQNNLASMGGTYEDYEPAYSYGSTMRSDKRYADRSWTEVEADAQRDWTGRNPGASWDKAKQAVKHGWEAMTGKR